MYAKGRKKEVTTHFHKKQGQRVIMQPSNRPAQVQNQFSVWTIPPPFHLHQHAEMTTPVHVSAGPPILKMTSWPLAGGKRVFSSSTTTFTQATINPWIFQEPWDRGGGFSLRFLSNRSRFGGRVFREQTPVA